MVSAIGAASAQRSHEDAANGALPSPASASVAHLNVKGTAMVASLAASNSTIAAATRRPDIGPQAAHDHEQRGAAVGGHVAFECLGRTRRGLHSAPGLHRRAASAGRRTTLI